MTQKDNSVYIPSEAQQLLIQRKLLATRLIENLSKPLAITAIAKAMDVTERQAYKIFNYVLDQDWIIIEPAHVILTRNGIQASKP